MPTISVIIPAYNAERTISKTIQSVLDQSFLNFELIIVNDGSTDRTLELLSSLNDSRIKVFSYQNGGLPVARNRGINHSNGKYISFLDADDLWTVDKLELQLAALEDNPKAGVAYSWTCNMSADGATFYPGISVSYTGNVYSKLLVSNFIASGSNCLVRRDAIKTTGEFDPSLKSYEDWDYWLRLASQWPFTVVPKYQILYRQSSGAMSSKIDVMEKYALIVIERAFESAPIALKHLKRQSLAANYQYLAGMCLSFNAGDERLMQAGQQLWKSIYSYPCVLLSRKSQRYLLKWLLMRLLPPEVAQRLTRPVGLPHAISDPRLQCN